MLGFIREDGILWENRCLNKRIDARCLRYDRTDKERSEHDGKRTDADILATDDVQGKQYRKEQAESDEWQGPKE